MGSYSLLQGNLPEPGIEPRILALQTGSLVSEPPGKPNINQYIVFDYWLFIILCILYNPSSYFIFTFLFQFQYFLIISYMFSLCMSVLLQVVRISKIVFLSK